jgi:hypothetical protein
MNFKNQYQAKTRPPTNSSHASHLTEVKSLKIDTAELRRQSEEEQG